MFKRFYLAITDACNLNCPFCPNPKGHDFMSVTDIKRYLTQIKPYCDYLYLHLLGEPLLHPDLNEILDLADQMAFKIQLVTNGILLAHYPQLLEHPSLRKLAVSVHAVDKIKVEETYFETLDSLIEKMTAYPQKYLELRFYAPKSLNGQALAYLNDLKKRFNFEATTKKDSYRLKANVFAYFAELFTWPNINDPYLGNTGFCRGASEMLGVLPNGTVVICCLDSEGHTKIGNLKTNDLKTILAGETYQNICRAFKEGRLICDLCQRCRYRLRFAKVDK